MLWTGSAETARNAAPVASVLVIGTTLNGLMNLPDALQLANGWTQIGLYINSLCILTLVPTIVYAILHYGPVGAAAVRVALNTIYMLVGVPLTHQRLLKGAAWHWFRDDICAPLLDTLLVVGLSRWTLAGPLSPLASLLNLPLVLLCALLPAASVAPGVRGWMFVQLAKVIPSRTWGRRGYAPASLSEPSEK